MIIKKKITSSILALMLTVTGLIGNVSNIPVSAGYCNHSNTVEVCYGNVSGRWTFQGRNYVDCYTGIECYDCGTYLRTQGTHTCREYFGANVFSICPYK